MRTAVVVTLLAAVGVFPAGENRPGLSVEPKEAAPGTSIRVRGSAWVPGTSVQVQVCGANAVHGSADCDSEHAVTAMVAPTGVVEAGLTVGAPPAPCPCVVRVSMLPGATAAPATATLPFDVIGHRVAPVLKDIAPVRADIVGAEVVGGGERGELFGGRPRRTLVLQIRNAGTEPIVNAPLVAGWGVGDKPDSPLDSPRTGTLMPGRTAIYRIPVELPPASFGRFVVGGRYAGSVPFEAAFSTYPWGLLGVNVLAALLLLVGVRVALGRRMRRRRAAPAPSTRGAITAAGPPPTHHPVAPRSPSAVEVDEVLDYLDTVTRESGTNDIDRDALVTYLESRRTGPVDLAALKRFLVLPKGEG